MFEKINILGLNICRVNMKDSMNFVKGAIERKEKSIIFTPNSEIVMVANKDTEFKEILNKADLLVPDGIGLVLASKYLKKELQERVTGIDLMEEMLKYANEENKSIYILGAKPGVAKMACENIKAKYNNIDIKGSYHGYFKGFHIGMKDHMEEKLVLKEINEKKPDILFVAFGAPKQEKWINEFKDDIDANIFIGVGGSVDVYAGNVKRAPKIYQKLCIEWLYRVIKEPFRIKRIMLLPLFILKVLKNAK
ncbi:MAG: WecB/TagA/CpsF family glycosyltransferase [Peptostreptococcaceae bacterium]|nr:WecB/TagA/CpsF family glycosyltransferase [Peptostreptococcaceae bacterium]